MSIEPIEIKIIQQGSVLVNEGCVYRRGDGIVALAIDMRTKRGQVTGSLCLCDDSPGVSLGVSEDSINHDESKKDIDTDIVFPEFKGWNVWCAEYSRYTVAVCLYGPEEK